MFDRRVPEIFSRQAAKLAKNPEIPFSSKGGKRGFDEA
jgi:hypothetical protein